MKAKSFIMGLIFLLPTIGHTQADKDSVVTISQAKTFFYLDPFLKMYIEEQDTTRWPSMAEYQTIRNRYLATTFPLSQTIKAHYFLFKVVNDTPDSATFFIYSSPQEEVEIRATQGANGIWVNVPSTASSKIDYGIELHPFQLAAGDTLKVQMRFSLARQASNFPYYYFIPGIQQNQFATYWRGQLPWEERQLIILGMILMMGFYMAVKYIQIRQKEYVFYAGYVFFMVCFLWLKVIQVKYTPIFFKEELLYSFAYRATQAAGYCMYFLFFQKFLSTKKSLPNLHKQLNWTFAVLCFYILFDFGLTILAPKAIVLQQAVLWNVIRVVLMGWTFYSVAYVLAHRKRLPIPQLSSYLVGGVLALTFLALVSMLFSVNQGIEINFLPEPFNQPIFYFEVGVVLELLFFASGLGYKNRIDEIEKVQAQAALKHEAERLVFENYKAATEAREAERGRIAKDLHDGLGGMLSGIKFSLTGIRGNIDLKEGEAHRYDRALDQLGQSIQELRQVTHDMMPDVLLKYGLVTALKDYCDSLNNQTTLKISHQTVGQSRQFEPSKELILYRIVQELLTNTLRHSAATIALVQVVFSDEAVSITVEDNGRGFMLEKVSSQGIGLANLRERVSFLRGAIDIKTAPDQGTSVYVEVPI